MDDSAVAISLPTGGGAIQGIGETFSPDLFTGTGNFTVPIGLPPGRNGFQPSLRLVYSTGNGNGPFGSGWSLSVPGVARETSRGIPRYQDANDIFKLSGAEKLVPIAGDFPGVVLYRPRTEGLFARIDFHRDSENSFWIVRSKDGLVSVYGTPARLGEDPAVIADPDDPRRVFAWELTETRDPFGNRIRYEYLRDQGEDGRWDQLYLERIRYADTDAADASGEGFLISTTFEYEDRPDPFSSYRSGFQIRTARRCVRIDVRTHAESERLVRRYRFVYLDQQAVLENSGSETLMIGDAEVAAVPRSALPLNGMSLLSQVRITGHDESRPEPARRQQALPPLEFSYTRFDPRGRDFFPLEGRELPFKSLANSTLELIDLFGNGLPDLVEMNGVVRYWRNLGHGRFDLPRLMRDAPAGLSFADPAVQLIDANGDGRPDLLVNRPGLSGYYPIRFGGCWDRRSFQRYSVAPSFDLEGGDVALVDLDGDGVTDAIRSGPRLECYFNDPIEGWAETRRVERRPLEEFPNVNFADPRVRFADMSGDGLRDIVLVHDGNIEYWPNLGLGNWGPRVHMRNSPRFPGGYNPRQILIGDVDGDGVADLIFVDHCKLTLWINQSGNGWSEPIEIDGTPAFTHQDEVRLVDLLGSGVAGVLWSHSALAARRERFYFHDFTGGVKPYLLHRMDNHRGASTSVTYRSSTDEYLRDELRRETRWKTTLPSPVQVVSKVETLDAFSGGRICTEYRYHHGYWDGGEREYRGFGCVERLSSENFERYYAGHGDDNSNGDTFDAFDRVEPIHFAPPTLTRTWFHLGPVGDEFGGWDAVSYDDEYWSGDRPLFDAERAELASFLGTLEVRRDRRDALRSLRGTELRSELYALDDSPLADRPYTVSESAQGLREIDAPADETAARQRVFFPHSRAQRTTQWERGEDPITVFGFTGNYDDYGQPRTQTTLAVSRGRDFRIAAAAPGEPYLGTHTVTRFAQRDDGEAFMVNRVASVTTHEILNDGSMTLTELVSEVLNATATLRVTGQTLTFYDGEAFTGLPFGQIGDFGASVRSESLVLTEALLDEAYRSGEMVLAPSERPPYLDPDVPPVWTADYPQEFRNRLPPLGGYVFQPGDADHVRGYFAETARQRYDFHENVATARGQLLTQLDPLGRDTSITYDAFDLMPVIVTRPTGLTISAQYDYRLMQPVQVTDPNGNRTAFTFNALGLVESKVVMGKVGQEEGDTPEAPGTRFEYDLLAFEERGQPVSVRSIAREHHIHDTHVPLPERDATIENVAYSDGFGRILQTRTQAEDLFFGDSEFANNAGLPADQSQAGTVAAGQQPGVDDPPRVVVSGWQIYDNQGRVVEKYEPFFSLAGFQFAPPAQAQMGQRIRMFYNPRGQIVRTVNPDGSEQRVVYGVPADLGDPEIFAPTPWEAYTYDTNDNAGRTHPAESQNYQDHWNTPASAAIDALGRTIETVTRNGPDPDDDWFAVRSTYDIQGNLVSVTDALGRIAFRYVYDLAGSILRSDSIDAGLKRVVHDVLGSPVEQRDAKGALLLSAFDSLGRPIQLWARDGMDQSLTLRQRLIYGDSPESGLTQAEARARNLLGQPVDHYDEAGLLNSGAYDFKGNLLEKTRRAIRDEAILAGFAAPPPGFRIEAFRMDWQPAAGATLEDLANDLLEPTAYSTTTSYDALNRTTRILYPEDVEAQRRELVPRYNRAGALQGVSLDGAVYVERIAYNARGQRTLIAYGNGVMSRYAHDTRTFRLLRLRSERFSRPAEHTYQPTGTVLQDFAYEYDLAGNMLAIHDRTPGSGIPNTLLGRDALDRDFTYDPVYRLIRATGRECDVAPPSPPWDDTPRCQDPTLTRAYIQAYRYDPMGNMEVLRHTAASGAFTREFAHLTGTNRLTTMSVGATSFDYIYDASGNLERETTSRHFEWDHSNRMRVFRTQVEGVEPSVHAHYLYDATGQRIKKLVRRQGGRVDATVYIDGVFEHHRRVQSASAQQNNTLHVMDGQQRIALVRAGSPFSEDLTPPINFHLSDHLGSSNVVVDDAGVFLNREEYRPFGETSFGSFALKRYRYSNKERDEESGLYYYGARYLASWLARWTSPDPIGSVDGPNLYRFARGNPLHFVDPTGYASKPPKRGETGHVENYNKQSPATYDAAGKRLDESEHVIPRGNLEAVTHNPVTGTSDYTNKHYRNDATVKVEREMALDKTHQNRGGPKADNARTRALKAKASSGQPIDVNREVVEESLDNAKRARSKTGSKATQEALNRGALEQLGNLFSLQRLRQSGEAARHFSKALKKVAAAVPVAGATVGHASAAHAASEGDYTEAALDEFGNVPVAGDLVDAGRAGMDVGRGLDALYGVSSSAASMGGTVADALKDVGVNETGAEFAGGYATLASTPMHTAIATSEMSLDVASSGLELAGEGLSAAGSWLFD